MHSSESPGQGNPLPAVRPANRSLATSQPKASLSLKSPRLPRADRVLGHRGAPWSRGGGEGGRVRPSELIGPAAFVPPSPRYTIFPDERTAQMAFPALKPRAWLQVPVLTAGCFLCQTTCSLSPGGRSGVPASQAGWVLPKCSFDWRQPHFTELSLRQRWAPPCWST